MVLFRCPCLWSEAEEVRVLDYRHCSLAEVPNEVFNYERTLEELFLDANQIRDLPRPLFHCHGLCKLGLGDNDIHSLPPAIASLISLEELDISKNGILDIPDNIKGCKCLRVVDASINPLGKLPSGFTLLINLEELYLNDTFLEFLPANFGRLSKLKILELRENHLKTLPKSMARLIELTRLDIGQNDFTELPDVVGNLVKLSELWCDNNQMVTLPSVIGNLRKLCYLDASRNLIETVPMEIECCQALTDLTLTGNCLKQLPETLGSLKNLCTLRLDDNQLLNLPSIGSLVSLEELIVGQNDLSHLPHSIGLLRKLHFLNVDDNLLEELPPELGSCMGLTIFSARGNRLTSIPAELGHIVNLRIVNLCDNFIKSLPFSVTKLAKLQALWLSENQNKPLIPLQSDIDIDTGQRVLTCFILPQASKNETADSSSHMDAKCGCNNKSERRRQPRIKFSFDEELERPGRLVRAPTPYPKELKAHAKHAKNLALKYREMSVDIPSNAQVSSMAVVLKTPSMATASQVNIAPIVTSDRRIKIKEAKVTKAKVPSSPSKMHEKHNEEEIRMSNDKVNCVLNRSAAEEMPESGKFYRRDLGSFPGCWKMGRGHNGKIPTSPNLNRMKPLKFPAEHSSSLPELATRQDFQFAIRSSPMMTEGKFGRSLIRKVENRNGTENEQEMYANLVNRHRGRNYIGGTDGYRSDGESFRPSKLPERVSEAGGSNSGAKFALKQPRTTAKSPNIDNPDDSPVLSHNTETVGYGWENSQLSKKSGEASPKMITANQVKDPSPNVSPSRIPAPFLPPRKRLGPSTSQPIPLQYQARTQSQQLPLPLPPRQRTTPPPSPSIAPRQGSPAPALPPRDRTPRAPLVTQQRPTAAPFPTEAMMMRKPPPYHVAAALSRRLATDSSSHLSPPMKMHRNVPPPPSPTWPPPHGHHETKIATAFKLPGASPNASPHHRRRHTDPSADGFVEAGGPCEDMARAALVLENRYLDRRRSPSPSLKYKMPVQVEKNVPWSMGRRLSLNSLHRAPSLEGDTLMAQRSLRALYSGDANGDLGSVAISVYASPPHLRKRISPMPQSASAPSTPPGVDRSFSHLPPYRSPPTYPPTSCDVTRQMSKASPESYANANCERVFQTEQLQQHQAYAGHAPRSLLQDPVTLYRSSSRPSSFSSGSTANSQGTPEDRVGENSPLAAGSGTHGHAKPARMLRECFGGDRRTSKESVSGRSGIFTARPAMVEYTVPTVGLSCNSRSGSSNSISRLAGDLRSEPLARQEALVYSNPYTAHENSTVDNATGSPIRDGPFKTPHGSCIAHPMQTAIRPTWLFGQHKNPHVMPVVIQRNPDLGFSVAEGTGGKGIYVCSVTPDGPASSVLKPGDKLLLVDGMDFTRIGIERALLLLEDSGASVFMMISRK